VHLHRNSCGPAGKLVFTIFPSKLRLANKFVPPKLQVLYNCIASNCVALMVDETDMNTECWCHIMTEKLTL
jgi:hypothetical protein